MADDIKTKQAQDRKAEFVAARNVYIIIFVSFFGVALLAAFLTSQMESQKTGFRSIETEKPMSFIDQTYVKKHPADYVPPEKP